MEKRQRDGPEIGRCLPFYFATGQALHLANLQFGFCGAAQQFSTKILNSLTAESRFKTGYSCSAWVPLRRISYPGGTIRVLQRKGHNHATTGCTMTAAQRLRRRKAPTGYPASGPLSLVSLTIWALTRPPTTPLSRRFCGSGEPSCRVMPLQAVSAVSPPNWGASARRAPSQNRAGSVHLPEPAKW